MNKMTAVQQETVRQVRAMAAARVTAVYEADGLTAHFKYSDLRTLSLTYVPGKDVYRTRQTHITRACKVHTYDAGERTVAELVELVRSYN